MSIESSASRLQRVYNTRAHWRATTTIKQANACEDRTHSEPKADFEQQQKYVRIASTEIGCLAKCSRHARGSGSVSLRFNFGDYFSTKQILSRINVICVHVFCVKSRRQLLDSINEKQTICAARKVASNRKRGSIAKRDRSSVASARAAVAPRARRRRLKAPPVVCFSLVEGGASSNTRDARPQRSIALARIKRNKKTQLRARSRVFVFGFDLARASVSR